jgi:hypothetical protein
MNEAALNDSLYRETDLLFVSIGATYRLGLCCTAYFQQIQEVGVGGKVNKRIIDI